jgi:hypothetical protein
MARGGRLALALAVGALALSAGATTEVGGFAGTWVRHARERDDAARDQMIERVTEPMSVAFRGFARGVMRRRMVPAERYVIEAGDAPRIRNDRGVDYPLDGQPRVIDKDREVTSRVADGGIEQSWKEGESHGTTTWRLEDPDHLIVTQRVIDPHFEAPIEYSTSYRRES